MLRFPPWKVNHGMGSVWNKDSGLRPCSCPGSMVACHPALTLDALTPQLLPLYFFFFFCPDLLSSGCKYGHVQLSGVCFSRPDTLSLTHLYPPKNHCLRAVT